MTTADRRRSASLDHPETAVHSTTTLRRPLAERPYTLAVAFRHSGWQSLRQRVHDALRSLSTDPSRLSDFATCGSHAFVLRSRAEPDKYRIAGSTCKHRFCTPCAVERSRSIAMNVCDYLDRQPCRFITLTLQSTTESLADLLAKLTKSFARLRRWGTWRESVSGGCAFLEVKWNADKARWHPHLHCLVQGNFLPQRELSRRWHEITHGSRIVDIRLVKSQRHAARYVTKYASKPLNSTFHHDQARLREAMQALHGKRLCLTFGDWQNLTLVAHPAEEAWDNLGSLDALITAAASGEASARSIVDHVCGDAAAALVSRASAAIPRSPPPPLRWNQSTMWATFAESTEH